MSLLLICFFAVVLLLILVFIRWCHFAIVSWLRNALNAEVKIKTVGIWTLTGISIRFHPQQTLEIDRIWISSKLLNKDLPSYLVFCVGKTSVRFDVQVPLTPLVRKSSPGRVPKALLFLSKLMSIHIDSINVMLLNFTLSESLLHVTIKGITMLLDHRSKRLAWDLSVGNLSSEVLKSSVSDICLAEVSLGLLLSGDVSLPELKPGCLSLCVKTLTAKLHEGLFLSEVLLPPPSSTTTQNEAVEQWHQLIPQTVDVEFENTNITLSMHSQDRYLNWKLKSLKLAYGRESEQLIYLFAASSLELLLENGLLSQSRQRIFFLNTLRTDLQVKSKDISGSVTVNTCIIHYRHQDCSGLLDLLPWEELIHQTVHRKSRFPRLHDPVMIRSSVSDVSVSVELADTTPFSMDFISVSAELQHEPDDVKIKDISMDHFRWRVGQGSHIQQAPHPPGKHVWGEALILDSLSLQGSYNRPHMMESGSHAPSLSVQLNLKGFQVELSETYVLCLSRLLYFFRHPSSDETKHITSSVHLPLLFKLKCCLDDVNVFTYSNLSGALSLRIDTFRVQCIGKSSSVSLQGVSLSLLKTVTENMETCNPASQTSKPVLQLTAIALDHNITDWTLEVQCEEEELSVEWTPSDHMFLYQFVTETCSWWTVLCAEKETDDPVKLRGSETSSGQGRDLCVCVYLGHTHLRAHLSELNYIILHTQALSLSMDASSIHMHSSHLYLNFDGNDIFSFKELDVQMHHEPPEDMQLHRDPFPFLISPQNRIWVFTCPSLAVEFPYKYNFSDTFDKAISVQKWLKTMHSSTNPSNITERLPPDLVFKISQFSFVFLDGVFETKLHDNYELMKDESTEIPKRQQLLDKEMRKQHGQLLLASTIKEVYTMLDKEKIEVYIKRSILLYANTPMRKSLLDWRVSKLELVVLADDSLHGPEKVRQQLRDIDQISPFPREGLPLVVQWCRVVKLKLGTFTVAIRDYPRNLFEIRDWDLSGRLIGAQQDGHGQSYCKDVLPLGSPWGDVTVNRNVQTLKFYHDLKSNISLHTIVWGPCWHPAFALICQVLQILTKPTKDPSPPLAWWDKIRFRLHGRWVMDIDHINLHLLATKDPYNTTENMHWECNKLNFTWNPGQFTFKGDMDINVRTASKYDDICFIHLPNLHLTLDLQWLCQGNSHDHHAVMLCCAENLTYMTSGNCQDSYRAFRSENLNLDISMDLNQHSGIEPFQPRIFLYSSTLQWIQKFLATWTCVSWPICRGKLFHNLMPSGKKLNQHYKQIKFTASFPRLQVRCQASAAEQNSIQVECKKGNVNITGAQTLFSPASTVIRRPISVWKLTQMVSNLSELNIHLMASTYEMAVHQMNAQVNKSHLLSLSSLNYQRPDESNAFIHKLCLMELRASWTTTNRNIAIGLFDSYRNVALLKRNLSTEALNSLWIDTKLQPNKLKSSKGAPTITNPALLTISQGQKSLNEGTSMLQKLIEEQTHTSVVSPEEDSDVSNQLCGIAASQTDDIYKRSWHIELVNCQMMLRGTDTAGCILTSAANAQLFQCEHYPAWYSDTLKQKTTWTCMLNDMQYFATMEPNHSEHKERKLWLEVKNIETHRQHDNLDSVLELIDSGQAVRGIVNTTTDQPSKIRETQQLQRIISRCNCRINYISYSHDIDPELATHIRPPELPNKHEKEDFPKKQVVAVDTITLIHHDLEISTNPFQYAMILDIFNNLLLPVAPSEKEQRVRFQLNISSNHEVHRSSIEEQRSSILHLQEEVRQHISRIRFLEKEVYSNTRAQSEELVEIKVRLQNQLNEEKDDMLKKSEELNIRIRCFKYYQLQLANKLELPKNPEDVSVVRRTEIYFAQAHWCLTEDDGQLGIAELELKRFMYSKLNKSDGKAEHLLELGWLTMNNLLPNAAYKDNVVLRPQSPCLSGRQVSLRIFSKVGLPVGISVNEHFEVNVVPLTIQVSYEFYKRLMGFFFPGKNVEEEDICDEEDKPRKRPKHPVDDFDKMKERAAMNYFFTYIKIPQVPLCVSYMGATDVNLVLPDLEYSNKTWTWLDFAVAVKDSMKELRSKFLVEFGRQVLPKLRLHASGSDPQVNASEGVDARKANLLGVSTTDKSSSKKRRNPRR